MENDLPTKRRLNIHISESKDPGLISALNEIEGGDESLFVRAVLKQWFKTASESTDRATAIKALVKSYRLESYLASQGIDDNLIVKPPGENIYKNSVVPVKAGESENSSSNYAKASEQVFKKSDPSALRNEDERNSSKEMPVVSAKSKKVEEFDDSMF